MICTNGLKLNFVVKAELRQAAVPEGLIGGQPEIIIRLLHQLLPQKTHINNPIG
jgi:hypothetical protein